MSIGCDDGNFSSPKEFCEAALLGVGPLHTANDSYRARQGGEYCNEDFEEFSEVEGGIGL